MTTKDINFWLGEKELKTPMHDEIVLWTFNNAEKIITELNLLPVLPDAIGSTDKTQTCLVEKSFWDWETKTYNISKQKQTYLEEIKYYKEKSKNDNNYNSYLENNIKYFNELLESKKLIEEDYKLFESKRKEKINYLFDKKIEFHITNNYNGWNIGFVDLMVHVKPNLIGTKYFTEQYLKKDFTEGKRIFFEIKPEEGKRIFFEIKPEVKSIGEVIRQINFYRSYAIGEFVLVTKTEGLKDLFRTQNIHICEYKKEGEGDAI
jgi:hypothetical protein